MDQEKLALIWVEEYIPHMMIKEFIIYEKVLLLMMEKVIMVFFSGISMVILQIKMKASRVKCF